MPSNRVRWINGFATSEARTVPRTGATTASTTTSKRRADAARTTSRTSSTTDTAGSVNCSRNVATGGRIDAASFRNTHESNAVPLPWKVSAASETKTATPTNAATRARRCHEAASNGPVTPPMIAV